MKNDSPVDGLRFRIDHTMLPVADVARSAAFYTRLLGMTATPRLRDETRQVEKCHVGYGPRGAMPTIELIARIGPDATATLARSSGHICVYVDDLPRLCEILARHDTRFIEPLKVSDPDRRRVAAWIADPDGHVIELVESRAF